MDDVEFIEKSEQNIWDILYEMHKHGVRFEIILGIVTELKETLEMQSYVENWLRTATKSP